MTRSPIELFWTAKNYDMTRFADAVQYHSLSDLSLYTFQKPFFLKGEKIQKVKKRIDKGARELLQNVEVRTTPYHLPSHMLLSVFKPISKKLFNASGIFKRTNFWLAVLKKSQCQKWVHGHIYIHYILEHCRNQCGL